MAVRDSTNCLKIFAHFKAFSCEFSGGYLGNVFFQVGGSNTLSPSNLCDC